MDGRTENEIVRAIQSQVEWTRAHVEWTREIANAVDKLDNLVVLERIADALSVIAADITERKERERIAALPTCAYCESRIENDEPTVLRPSGLYHAACWEMTP